MTLLRIISVLTCLPNHFLHFVNQMLRCTCQVPRKLLDSDFFALSEIRLTRLEENSQIQIMMEEEISQSATQKPQIQRDFHHHFKII